MNKYRNKKTQVNIYLFDSIAESKRYRISIITKSRRDTKLRTTTEIFITRKL